MLVKALLKTSELTRAYTGKEAVELASSHHYDAILMDMKMPVMGGLEAVKWLVRYITCRKTDARKEEASVNSMEEENRRKKVDWLEERLTQRDEKIDGLYIELRKEQEEKIDWIHKCHEVELIQKESEVKKCEIRGCVKRMPPSDY